MQRLAKDCPRAWEAALVHRCAQTGRGLIVPAENAIIATIYELCSLLLSSACPSASKHLLVESARYYNENLAECISIGEVINSNYIVGLSRFSTKLSRALELHVTASVPAKTKVDFEYYLEYLFVSLEKRVKLNRRVNAYLSGDAATYFYTRNRLRPRIEVDFEGRFPGPDNIFSIVELQNHRSQMLYFDINYNANFKLLHERYRSDSEKMHLGLSMIDLRILRPVDLAVSKVLSSSIDDSNDVADIIQSGLASRQEIKDRGLAAISSMICDQDKIRKSYLAALAKFN